MPATAPHGPHCAQESVREQAEREERLRIESVRAAEARKQHAELMRVQREQRLTNYLQRHTHLFTALCTRCVRRPAAAVVP